MDTGSGCIGLPELPIELPPFVSVKQYGHITLVGVSRELYRDLRTLAHHERLSRWTRLLRYYNLRFIYFLTRTLFVLRFR